MKTLAWLSNNSGKKLAQTLEQVQNQQHPEATVEPEF
jgi:hypothetical protein